MSYKAFVSSTYKDLKGHRAHVICQLCKAGFIVDPMEDWPADADEPKEFSTRRLEGCHLCILLIARRRGHVPLGQSFSITQLEHAEAERRGIDVLPYLLDDSVPDDQWPWEEEDEVRQWRAEVSEHHGAENFKKTPATLDIAAALTRWIKDQGPEVALRLYLKNVRREHGTINFVSLPHLKETSDVPINDLYVIPEICVHPISSDSDPREWPNTTPVTEMPEKLVLLGDPGSGKSTFVSWLSWQMAEHYDGTPRLPSGTLDQSTAGHDASGPARQVGPTWQNLIPLPMILRDLGIGVGITWDGLLESFIAQSAYSVLTMANLERILEGGQAMIMLDGLDEIGKPQARRHLRNAVWEGIKKFGACRWLMTSRVVGYEDEELPFHVDFTAEIVRVDGEVPKTNIRDETKTDLRYVVPFDDPRVDQFALNWFAIREVSEHNARQDANKLVRAIREDAWTKDLSRIPILLTMMALILRIEAHLPNRRALLCHKIAEAYLHTIDYWKRINQRKERWEDRRNWLARVGFEMQRLRGEKKKDHDVITTGEQVRSWIAAAMKESGREAGDAEAAEFVDYLGRRTGLLLERGENRFAFIQLPFQEYFAAWYLKEKITTLAWARGDAQRIATGACPWDLNAYASEVGWRETIIFLIELMAAEDPDWLAAVFDCLFGKDYCELKTDQRKNHQKAVLLALVAAELQTRYSDDERSYAIRDCCNWEVRRQKEHDKTPWIGSREVMRVLLSSKFVPQQRILECFAASVLEAEADAISLAETTLSDIAPLSKLRDLHILDLGCTSVEDLTPLSGLTSLHWLDLKGTPVSDLNPISGLRRLRTLILNGTLASDLTPLAELARLEWLDLQRTPVSDLAELAGLRSLQQLFLEGTQVEDLTPIAGLRRVTIYLSKSQMVKVPRELEKQVARG